MDEIDFIHKMKEVGLDLVTAETLDAKALIFERALKILIKPKDQSDRTSFRNVIKFLKEGCGNGKFDESSIFRRVLDFALESTGPRVKNPAAVFMSIMKKELGYKK